MRVPPDGIDDRQLSGALAEHWGLAPARLGYLPVGWGDHHWELTDSAGRRWFVTVAGLAGGWRGTGPTAGFADLRAAMDTVTTLAGAGLDFAVAPVPTTDGRALAPLGAEHAITVFPYLDGACGDEMPPQDRLAVIDMLARLHNATPLARLYLIDWDTAGLAWPERDLWDVADADSLEADRYTELTGRRINAAAMRMYRMCWSLDDITLSLSDFRGPHEQNEDTDLAWAVLAEETENVLDLTGWCR